MKSSTKQRRIRKIVNSNVGNSAWGVTLPINLMDKWRNVYVTVKESGTSLILESGAKISSIKRTELRNISKTLEVIKI